MINVFNECVWGSTNKSYTYVLPSVDRFTLNVLHFPLLVCQFIFSLWNDPNYKSYMQASFMENSPFFSIVVFFWFFRYIYKSTKKQLASEDLQPLPIKIQASHVWERFQEKWNKALSKMEVERNRSDNEELKSWKVLAVVLIKTFWFYLACAVILQLIQVFLIFLPPLLLDKTIAYASGKDFSWKGHALGLALFISTFMVYLTRTFTTVFSILFANQLKSVTISAIYRKAIRLSTGSRRLYTSGEMVNLMSADVEHFYFLAFFNSLIIGSPLKLVITLVLLWQYIGPSCLAGAAVLVLMLLNGFFFARKTKVVEEHQMKTKDTRLKFMNEILNGIMVLKLYAWELPFMDRISKIRKKEVNLMRKFQLLYIGSSFNWNCGPLLIAVVCILTYSLTDKTHVLDATTIFVSINLLTILRNSIFEIPELTAKIVQTIVSLKRLFKFLTLEEYNEDAVGNSCNLGEVVSIRKGTFSWSKNGEPTLNSIDFHVPEGSLVAVIGPVGSGKSSLISAILGEMYTKDGSVDVKGSISYVPQQAWILNKTLRENILFVNPMKKSKYETILESCCLRPDLEMLPGGDKTEIGEKGVTLSGGQKQRVSLARAVFHDADIYLLDDPLSAVDSHVGKHIFEHVIGRSGLLQNKTRILVTHNVSVLPETDFIFTIKDGKIHESGTYNELMKSGGVFSDFIEEHMNFKDNDENGWKSDELKPLTVQSVNNSGPLLRNQSVESTTSAVSGKLVDDENMEIGQVKYTVYINFAKHLGFLFFFGVVLCILCSEALEIGATVWLSKWSSDPILSDGTQDVHQRNYRMIIYVVLGLLKIIAVILASVCLAFGSARAAKLYHREMLSSIMRAPMFFFDTTPLGRIINRFGRDIADVDTALGAHMAGVATTFFSAIGTFIVIGTNAPIFLAYLIPIGLIFYVVKHFYLITSRQMKRLSSTTRSPVYSHFTESINGTSSIRAYKVADSFVRIANEKLDTNIKCLFIWSMANRWLQFYISFVGVLILLAAAILVIESKNVLEAGVVGLTITYAINVTHELIRMVYSATELENKSISVERIEEYSSLPSEAPWKTSESFPPASWPLNGKMEFKSYSTRYREHLDLVIKKMDLKIEKNEKVGIVGRTGAGKSSFALALFRIIEPVEGRILIDEIDVSKIGLHQLRSKLTIIPQDPVLFNGSLRMNLDPNSTHSDAELWLSLQSAHLKEFVDSLPEGLSFEIAEGGDNLSVGQRQLICLARALLKQAKILILDEATAAVDMDTDRLIQDTIRSEFRYCTVITIAHRLNTIMDYDKVVVMNAGEVIEVGAPSQLLQKANSHFFSMARDAGLA